MTLNYLYIFTKLKLLGIKIKIPLKYKKNLKNRFDTKNAKRRTKRFVISIPCLLCEDYFSNNCCFCPIKKYTRRRQGCLLLIKYFVNTKQLLIPMVKNKTIKASLIAITTKHIHWGNQTKGTGTTKGERVINNINDFIEKHIEFYEHT